MYTFFGMENLICTVPNFYGSIQGHHLLAHPIHQKIVRLAFASRFGAQFNFIGRTVGWLVGSLVG